METVSCNLKFLRERNSKSHAYIHTYIHTCIHANYFSTSFIKTPLKNETIFVFFPLKTLFLFLVFCFRRKIGSSLFCMSQQNDLMFWGGEYRDEMKVGMEQ